MERAIETARLRLSPIADADIDAWAALLGDGAATRLLHNPEPVDRATALERLDAWVARFDAPVGFYAVATRDDDRAVGFVGFVPRTLAWGDEIEFGWMLLRDQWGRGYATEAARALRPLVPGRVVSMIRVENSASAGVARKLGMDVERTMDWYGFATDVWVSAAPGAIPAT